MPEDAAASLRTLVYAGRFADKVSSAKLPDGCEVLSEWDVLPSQLTALEHAAMLVVLDLFSFPFESMTEKQRDVPLVVILPSVRIRSGARSRISIRVKVIGSFRVTMGQLFRRFSPQPGR